jgi:hypothetical protein
MVMQDVDVVVAVASTLPGAPDILTAPFYESFVEDLLDQCKAVVLRITPRKGERRRKPLTADEVLTDSALRMASIYREKLCKYLQPLPLRVKSSV